MKCRIILLLWFFLFSLFCVSWPVWAQGKFVVFKFFLSDSEYTGENMLEDYENLLIEDLGNNGLKDILFLKGEKLLVFRQNPLSGYPDYPNEIVNLNGFSAIDISDIGLESEKGLILMNGDGVYCYTQKNGRFEPKPTQIIAEKTLYPSPLSRKIEVWDFAIDLNGDGKDEIILPKPDEIIIYWKNQKGFYEIKQKIPITSHVSVEFNDIISEYWMEILSSTPSTFNLFKNNPSGQSELSSAIRLTTNKFMFIDLNKDYRKDLVIIKQGTPKEPSGKRRFFVAYQHYIFLQDEQGFFPQEANRIFETYRSSWLSGFCNDINDDGEIDKLEIERLVSSSSVQRDLSVIKVFLASGGNTYPVHPWQTIRVKGNIWKNNPFLDLDRDGDLDLLIVTRPISVESVGSLVTRFLEKEEKFIFQFYLWEPEKGYPERPNFDKTIKLSPFSKQFLSFDGDFNGDGNPDIAVFKDESVEIFTLIDVKKGFSNKPWFIAAVDEFDSFYIDELNSDGKNDIVLVNSSTKTVKVMLSQKD